MNPEYQTRKLYSDIKNNKPAGINNRLFNKGLSRIEEAFLYFHEAEIGIAPEHTEADAPFDNLKNCSCNIPGFKPLNPDCLVHGL